MKFEKRPEEALGYAEGLQFKKRKHDGAGKPAAKRSRGEIPITHHADPEADDLFAARILENKGLLGQVIVGPGNPNIIIQKPVDGKKLTGAEHQAQGMDYLGRALPGVLITAGSTADVNTVDNESFAKISAKAFFGDVPGVKLITESARELMGAVANAEPGSLAGHVVVLYGSRNYEGWGINHLAAYLSDKTSLDEYNKVTNPGGLTREDKERANLVFEARCKLAGLKVVHNNAFKILGYNNKISPETTPVLYDLYQSMARTAGNTHDQGVLLHDLAVLVAQDVSQWQAFSFAKVLTELVAFDCALIESEEDRLKVRQSVSNLITNYGIELPQLPPVRSTSALVDNHIKIFDAIYAKLNNTFTPEAFSIFKKDIDVLLRGKLIPAHAVFYNPKDFNEELLKAEKLSRVAQIYSNTAVLYPLIADQLAALVAIEAAQIDGVAKEDDVGLLELARAVHFSGYEYGNSAFKTATEAPKDEEGATYYLDSENFVLAQRPDLMEKLNILDKQLKLHDKDSEKKKQLQTLREEIRKPINAFMDALLKRIERRLTCDLLNAKVLDKASEDAFYSRHPEVREWTAGYGVSLAEVAQKLGDSSESVAAFATRVETICTPEPKAASDSAPSETSGAGASSSRAAFFAPGVSGKADAAMSDNPRPAM